MKKVLVLLLSSGAMAAFGVLAVDVAPAMAAKCHCKRGPAGPAGPRGARGPRGFTGARGPAGPSGAGLNNFDAFLTKPGQVNAITFGALSVSDFEELSGSGCDGITVSNSGSSGWLAGDGSSYDSWDKGSTTNTYTSHNYGSDVNSVNIQAITIDGKSMLSAYVGDYDDDTPSAGPVSATCIDVGGVSGT